jgi:Glycosyl hydrolase catalytic core
MRNRTLPALVAAVVCPALVPAGAHAALTVGIAENQPTLFSDPLFQGLGAKHVRVVMSYDVMTSGDDELQRVTDYLTAAQAAGIEPLVTFEHARGPATGCGAAKNRRKRQCRLPSPRRYEREFKRFRKRFPLVRAYVPWNEINHVSQPTYRYPEAAAHFTRIVRRDCRGCTVVVADVLDRADKSRSKTPRFRSTLRYIKRFRKALRAPRKICGLHNYSDVNRFRDRGTKQIVKALGCREIWLTETGGIFKFRASGLGPSRARQLRATKYMFKLARRIKQVKRVYVYTWFGKVTPRFDAGLVAGGKARPAYAEVKKHLPRPKPKPPPPPPPPAGYEDPLAGP